MHSVWLPLNLLPIVDSIEREMTHFKLTFAFCTYNRAARLEKLVAQMRTQTCPIPFEILAVNNNSTDDTVSVLGRLAAQPGPPLRWVNEPVQGIVAARNRCIEEALDSDILVFIDDDELPLQGLIHAAADAILNENAECVGGRVEVDFSTTPRPPWLEDDLLGFLAAVDYGSDAFWIEDIETPIWTANVAYKMDLFRDDPELRFDKRYDRIGNVIGGGEDATIFRNLVKRGTRIRYRPDMAVLHAVESWRLRRSYFLTLHYMAGVRKRHDLPEYQRTWFGIPPFMISQMLKHLARTARMYITNKPGKLREAMNTTHALGLIRGCMMRNRTI